MEARMSGQPPTPGKLPPDDGRGLKFTRFASWVPERRFTEIEKLFNLPSPPDWFRENFIRRWWGFHLANLEHFAKSLNREGIPANQSL
jgi:hypothetical protein